MAKTVRTLTKADQSLIGLALLNNGIKARTRRFPTSLRVCFEGSQETALQVLNAEGFLNSSGEQFTRFNLNQPHEVFVYFAAI
jgi:hypothetical protein